MGNFSFCILLSKIANLKMTEDFDYSFNPMYIHFKTNNVMH